MADELYPDALSRRLASESAASKTDTPSTSFRSSEADFTDAATKTASSSATVARLSAAPKTASQVAAENSTTSRGNDPDNAFAALNSQEGWAPNLLGGINLATYHVRIFVTEDKPINNYNYASYEELVTAIYALKQTTIVETGTTGLNISSMEINMKTGPNGITRSMDADEFKITIQEPIGVSFLDQLSLASEELQIPNVQRTTYYLELNFRGYNEDGTMEFNPCKEQGNKGKWLYCVMMTSINSKVNSSGATYEITMVPQNQMFHEKKALMLPDVAMPSGNTVGEILTDLADKLNKGNIELYGYSTQTFKFLVHDLILDGKTYDVKGFKLTAKNEKVADKRSLTMETINGVLKASFQRGTMIHDAVELIMGTCEQAQQLAKAVSITEALDQKGKDEVRSSVIWRVQPEAVAAEYDYITESYIMNYTIHVTPFYTQTPILTKKQVEVSKDPKVQAKNVMDLRKFGYLSKRYDYIYTGMNTEVIDFDIFLNTQWAAIMPRAMGYGNSMASQETNDVYRDPSKLNAVEAQQKQARLKDINDTLTSINAIKLEVETGQRVRSPTQAQQDALKDAQARLAALPSEEALTTEATNIRQLITTNRSSIQSTGSARLAKPTENRDLVRYSEDLTAKANYTDRSALLPTSIEQGTEDARFFLSGATPDSYHRDRAIMGAVLDQVYKTSGQENLMMIKLEVKGDPYWLGNANVERTFKLRNADNVEKSIAVNVEQVIPKHTSTSFTPPDYNQGDILFLLTFKYPLGINEDGSPMLKDNEYYTGVYKVTSVLSRFEGGQFTQTIQAARQPLIDVFKAFGYPTDEQQKKIEQAAAVGGGRGSINPLIVQGQTNSETVVGGGRGTVNNTGR